MGGSSHSLLPTWFWFFHNQLCDLGKQLKHLDRQGIAVRQPSPPQGLMTGEKMGGKCLTGYQLHSGNSHPLPQHWPWRPAHSEPQPQGRRPAPFVQQGAVQPGEALGSGGRALSSSPVSGVFQLCDVRHLLPISDPSFLICETGSQHLPLTGPQGEHAGESMHQRTPVPPPQPVLPGASITHLQGPCPP